MIERSAVNVHLRIPLDYLMLELSNERILLQLVFLLDLLDFSVHVTVEHASAALSFDHFLIDERSERQLDILSNQVNVDCLRGAMSHSLRFVFLHYFTLGQVVIRLAFDLDKFLQGLAL